MKYNVGDTVDYKVSYCEFKSCTVVGFNKKDNDYMIQISEKYKVGWTSKEWHKKHYGVKVGTESCWCAQEPYLTLSRPNNRGKNPRGKNGRFTKKSNTKLPTIEERVTKIERELTNIVKVLGGNV